MPVAQDPQALAALAQAVAAHAPTGLAALGVAVPALGSLVLGLAMAAFRWMPPRRSRSPAWTRTSRPNCGAATGRPRTAPPERG